MFKKVFFIKIFALFYLFLLLLYAILKYGFNHDFMVKSLFGVSSVLNTYIYFILIALAFAIASTFLFKYYIRKKVLLRIFAFFPLIGLLTSVIGGFLCGILFSIHDMLAGFYPGSGRFISNMFGWGIETSFTGILLAFNSFAIFTVSLIAYAFGLLEFFRIIFIKRSQQNG